MLIELPVLVTVTAEPIAAVVVPFIGKAHGNAVVAKRPELLDQPVVELTAPLTLEKSFDRLATLEELGAVSPAAVDCVGERNAGGIARIPCILGQAHLLCGGLGRKWWQWRSARHCCSSSKVGRAALAASIPPTQPLASKFTEPGGQ